MRLDQKCFNHCSAISDHQNLECTSLHVYTWLMSGATSSTAHVLSAKHHTAPDHKIQNSISKIRSVRKNANFKKLHNYHPNIVLIIIMKYI